MEQERFLNLFFDWLRRQGMEIVLNKVAMESEDLDAIKLAFLEHLEYEEKLLTSTKMDKYESRTN